MIVLNMARDIKGNRKGFYKYISDKRKTRENLGPLLKERGDLVTQEMKKSKVLNNFFASFFTGKCSSQAAHSPNPKAGTGKMNYCPL